VVYLTESDIPKTAGQLSRKGEHHFCKIEWPRLTANQHLAIWNGLGLVIRMGRGHGRQPRHRSEAIQAKSTLPSLEMYQSEKHGWPCRKQRVEGKSPIYRLRLPCYRTLEEGKKLSAFLIILPCTSTQEYSCQKRRQITVAVIKRSMSMLLYDLPFFWYLFLSFSNTLH